MRRILSTAIALFLVGAVLFLFAASYEVTSLGSSLTRTVKSFRAPVPLSARTDRAARAAPARPDGPGVGRPSHERETSISFTATEEDLGRVLRRQDAWVGGWLSHTRDASCRLAGGQILIETRNRLRLLGVTVVRYSGFSDWTLAALRDGLGVRLSELRVAGIPVPGSSWLLRRFGKSQDGWIVVRTGSRTTVDRIDVADGRLTVVGRLRQSAGRTGPI